MRRAPTLIVATVATFFLLLAYFCGPITIRHVTPAEKECHCPPPLTPEQEEAQLKAAQKKQLERYMIDHFGGLPYSLD